jgi:hypothetical protein
MRDVGLKKPHARRLLRHLKSSTPGEDAEEAVLKEEVKEALQGELNKIDVTEYIPACGIPFAETVAELGESAAEAVFALAESIPVFGKCVSLLHGFKDSADAAKANEENCKQVAVWADAIKSALVMAAPVLISETGSAGSIVALIDSVVTNTSELLDLTKSYSSRSYMMRLCTSKVFKKKFDASKEEAQSMLNVLALSARGPAQAAVLIADFRGLNFAARRGPDRSGGAQSAWPFVCKGVKCASISRRKA